MLKNLDASKAGLELERLAKGAIRDLVANIPGVDAEIIDAQGSFGCDFEVDVAYEQGHETLLCDVRSRAWPNELHGVGHRLFRAVQQCSSKRCTPVFIAPYLSPQAVETCEELGLSWADLAGNCELKLEGAYVKVLGLPNQYKKGRGTASLYSPKSSAIVHALLLTPRRKWTTEQLATAASTSLGQVASVKKLLEKNHWIRYIHPWNRKRRAGRREFYPCARNPRKSQCE